MNKRLERMAFPLNPEMIFAADEYGGMTLRDYFAAKVLQGMWACSHISGDADELAKGAYAAADAMLKARE